MLGFRGLPAGAHNLSAEGRYESTLRYRVEWISERPLGARHESTVPLGALCGGARELLERCHALRWPGMTESEPASEAAPQEAPTSGAVDGHAGAAAAPQQAERAAVAARRSRRKHADAPMWRSAGGNERLGCGTDQ